MFSRTISKILRRSHYERILTCRAVTTKKPESNAGHERDSAPLFFNEEIQKALELLTRVDYRKVVRKRLTGEKLEPPEYKFMTDEQLQETLDLAKKRMRKRLQMPPVVRTREEINVVLNKDKELEGFDECKYVFTDITFGLKDRNRFIVVRELDGTLRYANWEERHRMNHTYFPLDGRQLVAPKLFGGKYFKDLLKREAYEYILDRACIQFEPDDPEYKRITEAVYETVNDNMHFTSLRSTRHFGPLAFYLVWHNKINNLLLDIIRSGEMEEAKTLLLLYHKVYPEAKSGLENCDTNDITEILLHYASSNDYSSNIIRKEVMAYREVCKQTEKAAEGIKKAHGIESEES